MPAWLRNDEERRQLFAALRSTPPPEPVRGSKRKKEEKPQPTVDRKLALLKLRDVACSGLREALWQDAEVQEILLKGLEDNQPELARILSLGVMVHLAASSRNCHSLLHNDQVRESLANLQTDGQPQEVREKGLLALVALAVPAFHDCQQVSEDLRDVLGKAARRNAETSQRLLVFRALWSAAAVCQSPELFFGNQVIWATVLQSLQEEEDADIREGGLGVLSALAGQQAVAHFLWQDEDESRVCEDIFLNTLRYQPSRIRGKALTVIASIVKNPEKRASVWSYVSLARRNLDQDDVHYAREMLGSAGSQRGRLGSDVSGGRPRAESDASAASKQSKQSGEDHVKRTHTDQDDQMDTPGTMKDSIIAAASKSELPSVQWPALSILLELAWDEELKMSLINCNVPELLIEALPDERLSMKERKLCKHGHRRLVDWNEARIAEELRIERENQSRELRNMLFEEEYQVICKELPEMGRADFESREFEDWTKRVEEQKAMKLEDELSLEFNKHLAFLLDMNRQSMQKEDDRSHLVREEEEKAAFADKVRAAREQAAEAARVAADAMRRVGGDAVLQARDAAVAAAAAAAKARMPPQLQAAFAAAEAAATGASAKQPLTQRGQLEEASKAALQVADRCGMTHDEKIAAGAAAAAAAATWATAEERGKIASSFALATAASLGMSDEAQQQAASAASIAAVTSAGEDRPSGYP
ncbi:unnamed protein product [Cladocopium goreaui]|uniref:Uncharacterized protein n=1 Tax=Cladocopium goreaui TaxID=2562237 RepID=A0A9P1CN20_9DINO|nr:unnamed protein product [Cladocopium goreaui]